MSEIDNICRYIITGYPTNNSHKDPEIRMPTGKERNQLAIYRNGLDTEFELIEIRTNIVSASGQST